MGDKIEKNEIDGACSAYRGEKYTGIWWENLRERDHFGDPGVWEDNIKTDLQGTGCGGMDWIELAEYRDRWRALANAVMNLRLS